MSTSLKLVCLVALIGYGSSTKEAVCTVFSVSFKLLGVLTLKQSRHSVTITGQIQGLPSNAKLGFHVHSTQNFSDPVNMCDSAGPHFNPLSTTHGCPGITKENHAGDFGNIPTDANGVATISINTNSISLVDGKRNVIGRSMVVHMGMDDCGNGGNPGSLANGNSGKRIACCAIGFAG